MEEEEGEVVAAGGAGGWGGEHKMDAPEFDGHSALQIGLHFQCA